MIGLADFTGRWHLTRRITDARGPDAVFTGTATFTPDDHGLLLHEVGELRLQGQGAFHAARSYLWRPDGAGIAVFFADGRDFHRFDLRGAVAKADHWCDPDTYKVQYDFAQWPLWQAEWRVIGPRKDYVMRSEYRAEDGITARD